MIYLWSPPPPPKIHCFVVGLGSEGGKVKILIICISSLIREENSSKTYEVIIMTGGFCRIRVHKTLTLDWLCRDRYRSAERVTYVINDIKWSSL